MADCIRREDAIRKAKMANHDTNCGYVDWEQDKRTELYINEIPAVDVAPIKRGNWRDDVVSFYRKCSECGCCVEWNKKPFLFGDGEYNYCPNCGAKMEAQDG